jgi:hypothetical protein
MQKPQRLVQEEIHGAVLAVRCRCPHVQLQIVRENIQEIQPGAQKGVTAVQGIQRQQNVGLFPGGADGFPLISGGEEQAA